MTIRDTSGAAEDADAAQFPRAVIEDPDRLAALDALGILDTPPDETFDSIAAVASEVCGAAIALVSLIGRDRQWFKAKIGTDLEETTPERAVCAYTFGQSDILVIPDLTQDPRSRDNPMVTGPEAIRFYAGAPLTTDDGHSLGTLCVIDTVPRPEGLTESQERILRHLASQVMTQMEMRRLLGQRDDLLARLDETRREASKDRRRLSAFVEHAPSLMALQRGPDHVFETVNPAFRALVTGRDVVGMSLAQALPEAASQGFAAIQDDVLRTGEPYSMQAARWTPETRDGTTPTEYFLDLTYYPIWEDDRVTGILTVGQDVTARVRQVRRQEALSDLGERLRSHTDAEAMIHSASETVAKALDAAGATFGVVDAERETVLTQSHWRADGAAPVDGTFAFSDYGSLRGDLMSGRPLLIEDVNTDPRTAGHAEAFAALGIRGLITVPILEAGRLTSVAAIHFAGRRALSDEDADFVEQVADRTRAALARIKAEARQRALNDELAHRMKNALAMVQAIVTQSLRQARTLEDGRRAISSRLTAMGRAQDILVRSSWEAADLRSVVEESIGPHRGDGSRITCSGPQCRLGAQEALGLALAIHELATNAAKYGALSTDSGRVAITWQDDGGHFVFRWIEMDGPPVVTP